MTNLPIKDYKFYDKPSVFQAENLLREARRQKGITEITIPEVCILDPDGDIEEFVIKTYHAELNRAWACYHTQLFEFAHHNEKIGIIGRAVGASFAVLLAEQLFASGCKLLLSMTSSGQLVKQMEPPHFILIEKAVRDEGTSYHYLPPSQFSFLNSDLKTKLSGTFDNLNIKIFTGSTWTTDAPYRETEEVINHYKSIGIHAVEMEASALYAFAEAQNKQVICFAHVTNQMASIDGDFEKGEHNGSVDALKVLFRVIEWLKVNL
jgi:purine-nucleoside phosphorylase